MSDRTLPWDWYPGVIPDGVEIDGTAYVETSFSFLLYRGQRRPGVVYGRGASSYLGTMFDVGPRGRVTLGEYALVHGARIICDDEVRIGDHVMISWNVVLMDTYRFSADPAARRAELQVVPGTLPRVLTGAAEPRPIDIRRNAWIGFDAVVLPGVTIGEGSVVGAKSVVVDDVPPYTVVAGNPARVVRTIAREDERVVAAR